MFDKISFFPEQASTFANEVDVLYLTIWGLTIFFSALVVVMMLILGIRYRRHNKIDRTHPVHTHHGLELAWSVIPLILGLMIFAWGAKLYADAYKVPENAEEVFVIGKQWMWHLQHSNGIRENNELHVPVGRPFKLTMISQDVIHSFFIPAFRVKRDVLPGHYSSAWFTATKPGKYHLFCAEYCGNEHSRMVGSVYVMTPEDFQRWQDLKGTAGGELKNPVVKKTLADEGFEIFQSVGCSNCHVAEDTARAPSLNGIYGKKRQMQNGEVLLADRDYMRSNILTPNDKITAGYEATMPTYQGSLTEEQVNSLTAYMKTLGTPDEPKPAGGEIKVRAGKVVNPPPANSTKPATGTTTGGRL